MATSQTYEHLDEDHQAACLQWNECITHTNKRLPALINPADDSLLRTTGYETWEDFRQALDETTKAAGFVTKIKDSGKGYKTIICNRGGGKPSEATRKQPLSIKVDCQWQAVVHCNKKTNNNWVLVKIKHLSHETHAPQETGAAEKDWFRFTSEQEAYAKRKMEDPLMRPRILEADLRREFPGIQLGQSA